MLITILPAPDHRTSGQQWGRPCRCSARSTRSCQPAPRSGDQPGTWHRRPIRGPCHQPMRSHLPGGEHLAVPDAVELPGVVAHLFPAGGVALQQSGDWWKCFCFAKCYIFTWHCRNESAGYQTVHGVNVFWKLRRSTSSSWSWLKKNKNIFSFPLPDIKIDRVPRLVCRDYSKHLVWAQERERKYKHLITIWNSSVNWLPSVRPLKINLLLGKT